MEEIVSAFDKSMAKRKQGGKNSAKWTDDLKSTARQIYSEELSRGISKENAITTTRTRLDKEHDFEIGRTSLQSVIKNPPNS